MPTPMSGNVQSKSADGKRIKLDDGNWYGAFAAASLAHVIVGDHVNFNYDLSAKTDQNGNPYRNIKSAVTKAGGSSTPSVPNTAINNNVVTKVGEPILSNSRCIIRQNALTNATSLVRASIEKIEVGASWPDSDDIINSVLLFAKAFEAYTSGDDDEAQAKKELGEE
jgi:hypothetical protein